MFHDKDYIVTVSVCVCIRVKAKRRHHELWDDSVCGQHSLELDASTVKMCEVESQKPEEDCV